MLKVVRNGMVAVLYSSNFGAGWSTWVEDKYKDLFLFHPTLVQMVEEGKRDELADEDKVKEILGLSKDDYICCGGAQNLRIAWIQEGTSFYIHEYDGNESIRYGSQDFTVA